jgi:hypothetical protein
MTRNVSNVQEYCISGWIKVPVGNKVDRSGNPLTIKGRSLYFIKDSPALTEPAPEPDRRHRLETTGLSPAMGDRATEVVPSFQDNARWWTPPKAIECRVQLRSSRNSRVPTTWWFQAPAAAQVMATPSSVGRRPLDGGAQRRV